MLNFHGLVTRATVAINGLMMKRDLWHTLRISALLIPMTFLPGCRTVSHAQTGSLVGAGFGGVIGSMVGQRSGHAGSGALLGAMTGAVVGGLAGDAEDAREQRDAAIAQAQYERHLSHQQAVTNLDLISMAQAGLSDQVIVNSVQTRGGQFDLSPGGIIELKNRGVSDNVILAIQQTDVRRPLPTTYVYPTTTVVAPAQTVYVAPRPSVGVGFVFGSRPHYHRGYYGRYHHW